MIRFDSCYVKSSWRLNFYYLSFVFLKQPRAIDLLFNFFFSFDICIELVVFACTESLSGNIRKELKGLFFSLSNYLMRSRHFGRQGSPIWQPYLYWHPTVCVCVCLLCVLLIRLIAPARLDMLDWATDKTVKRLAHKTHTQKGLVCFSFDVAGGGEISSFFPSPLCV